VVAYVRERTRRKGVVRVLKDVFKKAKPPQAIVTKEFGKIYNILT
jgi:hypothetical protein